MDLSLSPTFPNTAISFVAYFLFCTLFLPLLLLRVAPAPQFIVPHQDDLLRGALGRCMKEWKENGF